MHVLSGCRWYNCPPEYGPPTTVYNRFVRWARRGLWENLFRELAGCGRSADTASPPVSRMAIRRFDVGGFDHLRVCRSPTPGQFSEQVLPQPALRPAHETVIDCRRRPVLGRAITPAAATLENMHDPADDSAIVNPFRRREPWSANTVQFEPTALRSAKTDSCA